MCVLFACDYQYSTSVLHKTTYDCTVMYVHEIIKQYLLIISTNSLNCITRILYCIWLAMQIQDALYVPSIYSSTCCNFIGQFNVSSDWLLLDCHILHL